MTNMHSVPFRALHIVVVSALLLTPTALPADEAFELVADFATGSQQDGLFPTFYDDTGSVILAGRTLFRGRDEVHGYELWASDGTALGTELLVDLAPGPSNGLRESQFPVLDGLAYFVVLNQRGEYELWRTDGTAAGTESFLSPIGANEEVVVAGNRLWFRGWDATHGEEPWVSDGTELGTGLLADLEPGPEGSEPEFFTAAGARVYFSAFTTSSGRELFSSDGTSPGTAQVAEIEPGPGGSLPTAMMALGNLLLFRAFESSNGSELWRTDGTGGGTFRLDIRPGAESSFPTPVGVIGSTMIVIAEDDTTGRELWRTNGTAVQQIIDLHPGDRDGVTFPFAAAVHGGFLYFAGDDDIDGSELWRTDGTMAGTTQVADIRPGSLGSRPASMVLANGQILFSADDGTTGRELWATNASGTSAQRITDLDNGPESSLNDDVTGFPGPSGDFLFVAETGDLGMELWRTDGTLGGTLRLTDVTEPVSSFPRFLTPWRGGLACKLYLGPTAAQLVTVDGVTLDSTVHSFPDPADYDLSESLVVWNDTLFLDEEFAGSLGQKLWTWDGMSETLIAEITGIPTMGSLYPTTDGVVFAREDELHRTDGTSVASMDDLVIDPTLPGGIILSTQENLILLQDYTSDTTYRVDLDDNSVITYPSLTTDGSQWRHFLGTVGGVSYFTTLTTLDPVLFVWETNLWASDGTPAGTEKLMVLPGVINPDVLEIDGQAHIIVPGTGAASWELHATDGTAAGTVLVASGPSYVRNWVAGETWAVLDTDDGLVLTDGTAAGSMLLPDTVGAGVHQALDGWALVSTIEEGRGLELALVNAADGSIVPLPEIQPGPAGTSIFYTVVADQRLWVTAFRADVGNELFTLDLTPFITAPSAALFSDGFESGDVTSWLGSVP